MIAFQPPQGLPRQRSGSAARDQNSKRPASIMETLRQRSGTVGSPLAPGYSGASQTAVNQRSFLSGGAQPRGVAQNFRALTGIASPSENAIGQPPASVMAQRSAGRHGSMRHAAHTEGAIFSDSAGSIDE